MGVEILSEEHRSLPVREALSRAAESARRHSTSRLSNRGTVDPRQACARRRQPLDLDR